jgi:hypothetical protein
MVAKSRIALRLFCVVTFMAAAAANIASAAEMLTIEGETLVARAKANAGKVAVQPMARFGTGWSGNAHLLWSGGATGAVLDMVIDVPASALYAVEIYFTRAPDYGQVAIEVDGNSSPATFSGFAPRVAPPAPTQAGKFPLRAGAHKLSLKITGKIAQSSGYLVGLDQVKLYPAGDLSDQSGVSRATSQAAPARTPANTPQAPARRDGAIASSQQAKNPGTDCDSTCMGNVSSVFRKTDGGQCKLWFRTPCNPYNCDQANGVCRGSCASDTDCAQGAHCNTSTGMCAAYGSACVDAKTVRMSNGQTQSCMPYSCVAGTCKPYCQVQSDCASGFSCEIATARCLKVPSKP